MVTPGAGAEYASLWRGMGVWVAGQGEAGIWGLQSLVNLAFPDPHPGRYGSSYSCDPGKSAVLSLHSAACWRYGSVFATLGD